MQRSFPFNAVLTENGYDRVYSAEDFAMERAAYVTDGVMGQDSLAVSVLGDTWGVSVSAGMASLRGRTYFNDEAYVLTPELSDVSYPRIDRVVLRLDYLRREIVLALKTGVASAMPDAPELIDNEECVEFPLAQIRIAANAAGLDASAITDERVMAQFPIHYEELIEEFTQSLRDILSVEDLEGIRRVAQKVVVNGDGSRALFNDGNYREVGSLQKLVEYTTSGTFSTQQYPSRNKLYYFMLLGGGGAGAGGNSYTDRGICGGGSGALLTIGPIEIPDGNYTVAVGSGGMIGNKTSGGDGGDTSFFGFTAPGGKGGIAADISTQPKNAGEGSYCLRGEDGILNGKGGSSPFGTGGAYKEKSDGSGGDATGYGAGGGAGANYSNGGIGTGGFVRIFGYQ